MASPRKIFIPSEKWNPFGKLVISSMGRSRRGGEVNQPSKRGDKGRVVREGTKERESQERKRWEKGLKEG